MWDNHANTNEHGSRYSPNLHGASGANGGIYGHGNVSGNGGANGHSSVNGNHGSGSPHLHAFSQATPHTGTGRKTILLADELALVREGLAHLCQADPRYEVVAQCGDGEAAVELIESLKPDVAVLDIDLPKLHALEAIRRVHEMQRETRVVVLAVRRDRKTVIETLRAGAHGFVLKGGPARHLIDAFQHVLEGGVYVSPMLELNQLFTAPKKRRAEDPVESLSSREYQVFCLLVDGLRAKEIACRLDLSPKTVDTYRASLMRKLDIYDIAGLVKFAIQRKLTSAV
jgi:DNA-binding NarL/FixJ family response regulator